MSAPATSGTTNTGAGAANSGSGGGSGRSGGGGLFSGGLGINSRTILLLLLLQQAQCRDAAWNCCERDFGSFSAFFPFKF